MPEALANALRSYVTDNAGYLFATKQGRPLLSRNVLRVLHKAWSDAEFHAFRRFRMTWLRRNSVPKDLERYWMGHAPGEVGDLYSKLNDDLIFRREWTEKIGLGFELVHNGPQKAETMNTEKAA